MARRPLLRPAAAPQPTAREQLFRTWPGRVFLAAAALKFVFAIWRVAGELPSVARIVSSAATVALAVALVVFVWRLFVQVKRALLWRVRQKLILSYIFIGVIPSLLILVFFLFAGSLVFMNVSAYLFRDSYEKVIEDARLSAQAAATEIARAPGGSATAAGPWKMLPVPVRVPTWMAAREGWAGAIGVPVKDAPGEEDLV